MGNQVVPARRYEEIREELTAKSLVSKFNANRHDRDMRWSIEREHALRIIKGSPQLMRCEPETVALSMMEVANTALSLAPYTGYGYLIPYADKDQGIVECTFQPGYRGIAMLAQRGGAVTGINCNLVYEHDEFRAYTENNRRKIEHEENYKALNRGKLIAAYTIAHLASGEDLVEVTPASIIDAARKQAFSRGEKGGMVWRGDFVDQMQRKVSIRRCLKLAPTDSEGWLSHAMKVVDKFDNVPLGGGDTDPAGSAEITLADDQVQKLHAWLTDRGFDARRAAQWLTGLAEYHGVRRIEDVPAKRFEALMAQLEARYAKVPPSRRPAP